MKVLASHTKNYQMVQDIKLAEFGRCQLPGHRQIPWWQDDTSQIREREKKKKMGKESAEEE